MNTFNPQTASKAPNTRNHVEVIEVKGPRLDTNNARALVDRATELFAVSPKAIVIDLSKVSFMDSLGVAALAAVHRRAPNNITIVLSGLQGYVQTVARITRLPEVFSIYSTSAAAVSALS